MSAWTEDVLNWATKKKLRCADAEWQSKNKSIKDQEEIKVYTRKRWNVEEEWNVKEKNENDAAASRLREQLLPKMRICLKTEEIINSLTRIFNNVQMC